MDELEELLNGYHAVSLSEFKEAFVSIGSIKPEPLDIDKMNERIIDFLRTLNGKKQEDKNNIERN